MSIVDKILKELKIMSTVMFMGEKTYQIWAEWASISKLPMHASCISILEKNSNYYCYSLITKNY